MPEGDRVKLLGGPYRQPALHVGDRATCLFRDTDVVITSWTDAPISWPRCRPVDVPRSHLSLLVNDELLRAIRTESAAALCHWWGVSVGVVSRWRKAFGIGRAGTPGSARLVQAAAQLGADAVKAREWSADERERRRQSAIENNLAANLLPIGSKIFPGWTTEEIALLGTAPDGDVAAQIGRTAGAVRQKREEIGIANPCDGRKQRRRQR